MAAAKREMFFVYRMFKPFHIQDTGTVFYQKWSYVWKIIETEID